MWIIRGHPACKLSNARVETIVSALGHVTRILVGLLGSDLEPPRPFPCRVPVPETNYILLVSSSVDRKISQGRWQPLSHGRGGRHGDDPLLPPYTYSVAARGLWEVNHDHR